MGSAECDVFATYAEPSATTAERVAAFCARVKSAYVSPDHCRDGRGGVG